MHTVILGKHFSFAEWLEFVREEEDETACRFVADRGVVCQGTVPGKHGCNNERSMHYHLLNDCMEYSISKINNQQYNVLIHSPGISLKFSQPSTL